jgi:short/branched chain acyl-CoA dehydrogenase
VDLDLTQEQEEFRRAVREFAEGVVAPGTEERGRDGRFPLEIVRQMAELGLFGLPFPERYGGLDADFLTFCLCLEEVARVDSSLALMLQAAVGLGANPVYRFGTEQQKQRWLVPMARGYILGSFGLAEPGGTPDARSIQTTARLEGDEWVIDGAKAFVANSGTPISKVCTVAAVTGRREISSIIVPIDTPGLSVGPPDPKAEGHTSDPRELALSGCRVPRENLLGERGRGPAQLLELLDDGEIAIAALLTGLARGLEEAVTRAMERERLDEASDGLEAFKLKMGDIRTGVENARAAYVRAAWLKGHGRPYANQVAVAKLLAGELRQLLIAGDLDLPGMDPSLGLKSRGTGDEEDG